MPLTRQQVRDFDRHAIEKWGLPGIVLMENAGRNAAGLILEALAHDRSGPDAEVAILCGGGNNGGDGYVIARHLHNQGIAVRLCAAKDPEELTGDARVNATVCAHLGIDIRTEFDRARWARSRVLVDALLGTGFTGPVREPLARLIHEVNACSGPYVVAVDLPSGLDCDTGEPAAATIRADMTVTFVDRKVGFDNPRSTAYTGEVKVVDIGVVAEPRESSTADS